MNINQVTIAGRVTKEIELKALPSGTRVANFSLATNRYYKDASGAKKEEVEFINCVAFGKTAETIAQYVIRGQVLLVQGRLKTSVWEKKDGGKGSKTEVIVETFQFGQKPNGATPTRNQREDEGIDTDEEMPDDVNVEDIPF